MILFDTPNEEAARVIFDEYEKIVYAIGKMHVKADRHFSRLPRYPHPAPLTLQYTVPASHNTYTVIYSIEDGSITFNSFLKISGNGGHTKYYIIKKCSTPVQDAFSVPAWNLDIYTGHFLSRYRERSDSVGYSTDELMARFRKNNRNRTIIPADYVNPKISEPDQYAIIVTEGLCFAEQKTTSVNGTTVVITENKTFVSKENLFFSQAIAAFASENHIKKERLRKAIEDGAPQEEIDRILRTGVFEPNVR